LIILKRGSSSSSNTPQGENMSKKKKKTKSKTSSTKKSPTAAIIQNSKEELKNKKKNPIEKRGTDKSKGDIETQKSLQSAIQEAILRLEPVSQEEKKKNTTKNDLESTIRDVLENLTSATLEEKSLLSKKPSLQNDILEAKEQLVKTPKSDKKEDQTNENLKSAILNAISSLESVHDEDKTHSFSKKDLELAIKDAKADLVSVADSKKKHVLQKKDLQTEIKDVKAGLKKVSEEEKRHTLQKQDMKVKVKDHRSELKPISEEVKRPQLSTKQLRTSYKDSRAQLESVPSDVRSMTSFSLGESIKEEGEKIKRELLPIPGDVDIFKIRDLNHIKEFAVDKQDFNYLLNHILQNEKTPLLQITINSRTLFNRIELLDENDPISVDNLIAGGDLVQFGQAYRFLLKFGYIRIKNPYPLLLKDEHWYVWHLKEEIDLTYADIAYARNSSVKDIRSLYGKADERIHEILDFVVYGGHYQLVAAHAMKKRGVLIQKIGDKIIEPKIEDYSAEEQMLKEMLEPSQKNQEKEEIPKDWSIKSEYKTESLSGSWYLWKEWLGALKNDKLLLLDNYELPSEKYFLREALGFGANVPPDIPQLFTDLIQIFRNVPDVLVDIGDAAYFIANIDSMYSSHFWNVNSFISDSDVKKWKKQFIKIAVKAYRSALKKYTILSFPLQFAQIKNDLGNFYLSLSEIEAKANNCKYAISSYQDALKIYSSSLFKYEYGQVNYNLGLAYYTLSELEEKELNIKMTILAFQEALKSRDLINSPFEYAITMVNQGIAYLNLALTTESEMYATFAIDSFNGALRAGSLDLILTEKSMIYNNIGLSYSILAELSSNEKKLANCNQAIVALNDSLTVRNQAQFPFEYAVTTSILADTYRIIAEVDKNEENCKLSISTYDKAIKIFIKKYENFYNELIKKKKQATSLCKELET